MGSPCLFASYILVNFGLRCARNIATASFTESGKNLRLRCRDTRPIIDESFRAWVESMSFRD